MERKKKVKKRKEVNYEEGRMEDFDSDCGERAERSTHHADHHELHRTRAFLRLQQKERGRRNDYFLRPLLIYLGAARPKDACYRRDARRGMELAKVELFKRQVDA